jgi:O-Antigen ligase
MGANPQRSFLGMFVPGEAWFNQIRKGFVRVSGPFGHAIIMGTIIGVALVLHVYISHMGLWERRFRFLPLPLRKQHLLLIGLVVGSLMTQSRGPWLAALLGVVLAACGASPNYRRVFIRATLSLIIGGFLVYSEIKAYLAPPTVSLAGKDYVAQNYRDKEEEASVEYRAVLVSQYQQIVMRQSFWGWGTTTWPKVKGMSSIDNAYLLISLMYGLTGLVLYGLILVFSFGRLLLRALSQQELPHSDRVTLFVLFGVGVLMAASTAATSLEEQLTPILFMVVGWGEACLLRSAQNAATVEEPVSLNWQPKFQFRSVLS